MTERTALVHACDQLGLPQPNYFVDVASAEDSPQETAALVGKMGAARGQTIVEELGEVDYDQYDSDHANALRELAIGRDVNRRQNYIDSLTPQKPRRVEKKMC